MRRVLPNKRGGEDCYGILGDTERDDRCAVRDSPCSLQTDGNCTISNHEPDQIQADLYYTQMAPLLT